MVTKKLIFLFALFFISFVSSATIINNVPGDTGLDIETPIVESHRQNTNFLVYAHPHNFTDGLELTNTTANCTYNLYSPENRTLLFTGDLDYIVTEEFFAEINAGNFSALGQYYIVIECETISLGGYTGNSFQVTPTGTLINSATTGMYTLLLALTIFFLLISLYAYQKLPSKNVQFGEGELVSIAWLKYLRFPLAIFSYVLVMSIIWLGGTMAYAYTPLSAIGPLLITLFRIMGIGLLLIFPIGLFVIIQKAVKDLQLKYMQNRGIF